MEHLKTAYIKSQATPTQTPDQYTIPAKLLSKGSTNAKTTKNSRETYILYLSPAAQNSKQKELCPHRSAGCTAACLYTAGRGKFNNVQKARINRANYLVNDPKTFCAQLILEIEFLIIRAKREKKQIAIRLNGTSDVDFLYLFKKYHGWNYEEKATAPGSNAPGIIFYDYTKNPHKVRRYGKGSKYALIFSRAEDNGETANRLLFEGHKVSAVFKDPEHLPNFNGYPIINGDERDDLIIDIFAQPYGKIIGLKAKGDAKKDSTGFTIQGGTNADGLKVWQTKM